MKPEALAPIVAKAIGDVTAPLHERLARIERVLDLTAPTAANSEHVPNFQAPAAKQRASIWVPGREDAPGDHVLHDNAFWRATITSKAVRPGDGTCWERRS